MYPVASLSYIILYSSIRNSSHIVHTASANKLVHICTEIRDLWNCIFDLRFVNLVNDQLDARFFYFIMRLLQSSTCFEQRRAHHQEGEFY